ncbi:ORC-CDC6 family AAA ATPase [Spirosoma aerophilum]
MEKINPFEYKYPDEISPKDVIDLFVPVFSDYFSIPEVGHTFINGARGSGKSMMFRFMRPDCQTLVSSNSDPLDKPRTIKELDYLGLYIPIKRGNLDKTEIKIIENKHGEALLNEHYMVLFFAIKIFDDLSKVDFEDSDLHRKDVINYFNDIFLEILSDCGYNLSSSLIKIDGNLPDTFSSIVKILKRVQKTFEREYIQKLIGAKETLPYNGPLFLYNDFLYEALRELRKLSFMPKKPIYLLVDDADNLNIIQQKILNSWVAQRTTSDISIKISTQLKYNTYRTINDSRIDTPHDYSVVNINDIYTSRKGLYLNRVQSMVQRRLNKFEYKDITPESFFPEDKEQAEKLSQLFKRYEQEHNYDYAYRYTVPDFIKNLEGNRYTFSYAGFEQLVNISSGILRDFVNFASKMYVHQISSNPDLDAIKFISPTVQDKIIKDCSDDFIFGDFDELIKDKENDQNKLIKLRNLLFGLGGLFKLIMISKASERRVFSVALNDEPDEELKSILDMGIQYNYFHKSLIGNKYGTGKSRLYILNRMLAPHFVLDPSSFAGYKFMDSSVLKISLTDPKKFINLLRKNITEDLNPSVVQQELFEN